MSILATEVDWPEGTKFFEIQCRLGLLGPDGEDDDKAPDVKTLGGTVRITPRTPSGRIRILEPDGKYRVVVTTPLTFAIDEPTGKLVNTADNTEGVWIVDPTSDTIDPKGFTYSAVVTPKVGSRFTVEFDGTVAINGVYDLANGAPVAPLRGDSLLESRIAKLELEGGPAGPKGDSGPDGRGIESITDDDEDGIATVLFTDGATADLPLPSTRIEGIEDVPGLVDLSDTVARIERNGDVLNENFSLNEPGDTYRIPTQWSVTYLRAGQDGAVLNVKPYDEFILSPHQVTQALWDDRLKYLYDTMTLVSGSVYSGTATFEAHLYTPYSHLKALNPHDQYVLKSTFPVRRGPGRVGEFSFPVYDGDLTGMRYHSMDGGGVGAWVWAKLPDGVRVVEGDTGWRDISSAGVTVKVLREGYTVHMILATGPTPPTETRVTPDIPLGFRSAGPPPLHHRCLGLLTRDTAEGSAVIYGSERQGHGLTFIGPVAANSRLHVSYRTDDPWPTTLPGTPA